MKHLKLIYLLIFMLIMSNSISAQDWANLEFYKTANAQLEPHQSGEARIVLLGNSIFKNWEKYYPEFFNDKSLVNRAISGQTTPQMLIRFRADVIDLKPEVVVILAGTNDIAGNTGPTTLKMIMDNISSMAELAIENEIKVVLCSVLPTLDYPWKTGLNPSGKIIALNKLIKDYADQKGIEYLDYYSMLVDEKGGLKTELTFDGVHPNKEGYLQMAPLTVETIKNTLTQKK